MGPLQASVVGQLAVSVTDISQIMMVIGQNQTYPMTSPLRLRIAFLLVVAAVAAVGIWLARAVSIDKCFDRGGAWDHDQTHCLVTAQ